MELCKSYLKNKNIKFESSNIDNKLLPNKNEIQAYFDNKHFVLFLKTIFYLNEEKILIFIENARKNANVNIENEILSDSYSNNEKHLILFNITESRINTLKTINLKIIFKLLTLLGNKNLNINKFSNFNFLIKKITLDYVKLLGDLFTFNSDFRLEIFREKKKESPYEKKLIVYLSNILEMIRLLYKFPETTFAELFENRVE